MKALTVVAKVVAKKDAVESLKTQLQKLVELTRQESGCIEYRLHQDNTDPAVFLFFENWDSASSLEQHMCSAHFKAYVETSTGLIAEKQVYLMSEV